MEKDKLKNMPNQTKHRNISLIKSIIRILGYVFLLYNIPIAVVILAASELLGVIEELV